MEPLVEPDHLPADKDEQASEGQERCTQDLDFRKQWLSLTRSVA